MVHGSYSLVGKHASYSNPLAGQVYVRENP